jgi:transposase
LKPWKKIGWVIPPLQNGDFVANMEKVLSVYKRPYDPKYPVICMDESPKQMIGETKVPIGSKPGSIEKFDYEYIRRGVSNIFMANEPLSGKRYVKVTKTKTKIDWAEYINEIAEKYKDAEVITLVMDNYGTHKPGALYEVYPPDKAKQLWDRFEFIYTPKHGSWLNMAEIELNVLMGQCLNRRIDNIEEVSKEAKAWMEARNKKNSKINWHFTTEDARIKLLRLYPTIYD